MNQAAFKDIDAAKAAAADLVYGVGKNYRWTREQWDAAKKELDDLGGGAWGLFSSWASMPWNPASWAGLDELAKLEAVQSYWESVSQLAAGWDYPGASKIRETATQAAITSGSEIAGYKASRPETIAAGGVAGTAQAYGEIAGQGADVLQAAGQNPRTTIAIVVGVGAVGLALYLALLKR